MKKSQIVTLSILVLIALVMPMKARAEAWGNDPGHNHVREAKNLPDRLSSETLIWQVDTGAKHQFPMP
ncbi:MAG: hypothetical protein ACOCVT_02785, partial [bacterium]